MATHRLLHVTRTGNDTDGLAEFTNSDTILLPIHSSDPSGTTEGEMIYKYAIPGSEFSGYTAR